MAVIRLPDKIFTGDYGDVVVPVSGDNGKALVWNQTNQRAEWVSVAASPGGSSGQVQYNNAGAFAGHSGFTYDGAGKVTLSAALVVPVVRPPSDSTAAFKIKTAADADFVTFDTTTPAVSIAGSVTIPNNKYYRATRVSGSVINLLGLDTNDILVFSGMNSVQFSNTNLALTNAATPAVIFSATGGSMRISVNTGLMTIANSTNSPLFTVANNGVSVVPILTLAAATTSYASLRVTSGTDPTSPNDGDIWYPNSSGRLTFRRSTTSEIVATGVQATGGSATAGVLYASAEQSMLQKCYDACRAFGLLS